MKCCTCFRLISFYNQTKTILTPFFRKITLKNSVLVKKTNKNLNFNKFKNVSQCDH